MRKKVTKIVLIASAVCFFSTICYSANTKGDGTAESLTRTISCERDECRFVLTITLENFDLVKSYKDFNIVDGVQVYGIDGPPPHGDDTYMITRIKTMSLEINKKVVPIDKSMYSCFLAPHIDEEHFAAYCSDDRKSVFVLLAGSDGAGSYHVIWCFSESGKCIMMRPTYDQLYFEMQDSCN